jgi:hypothetical protein
MDVRLDLYPNKATGANSPNQSAMFSWNTTCCQVSRSGPKHYTL